MHFAKIDSSERLKRVLQLLRERGSRGATTRDIIDAAHVCAVNSIIAELRSNGFIIDCTKETREVYRYMLIEGPALFGEAVSA